MNNEIAVGSGTHEEMLVSSDYVLCTEICDAQQGSLSLA